MINLIKNTLYPVHLWILVLSMNDGVKYFIYMSIIKSKHASNYTILPNEIFADGLSIEAIGLLSYFLSLPHDWVIYKTNLHEQLNLGREKLDRVFKELQDKGYIISVKEIDKNGKFNYNHIVYDRPFNGEPQTVKPLTAEPYTALPSTANQQLLNTNIQSTNKQSKQDKRKMFIAPALSDVIQYFKDNGYTESAATKAYNYYESAEWVDSKGNKVKNWKQKMQGVWFKDENKQQQIIKPSFPVPR